MTDASQEASKPAATDEDDDAVKRRRGGGAGAKVKAGSNAVRTRLASVVWLVAVVCALFLAVGALLVALNANEENNIVSFVLSGAEYLDWWFADLFTFSGKNAETKAALVNWGIAAVAYLVAGRILDRIIRP